MAVKRKSYVNKVSQCFLKNPKKQLKMRGGKNLYNDADYLKKWMCSEKSPFKLLSFPDFTNTSCDNNRLTDTTVTELETF